MNESAAHITRKAKSNLAFALACVPRVRRDDLVTFYAFCRIIDDLADDLDVPLARRQQGLADWKAALTDDTRDGPHLADEVRAVRDRHTIDPGLFLEIIAGCESDLHPQRFETWEDLQAYNYRVACAVGLASLPIFGASDASRDYAITLGHALQLTNIIRDVGEDLDNDGRIYLPRTELARFDYTEHDLTHRVHDERFVALMEFQARRAEDLYRQVENLRPPADRHALIAPEIMRHIYHAVLQRIRANQFRVFHHRHRVSKALKVSIMLRELICGKFSNS